MADSIECLSFRAAWCAAASVRPTRLSSRSQLQQGAYRSYTPGKKRLCARVWVGF